MRHGIMVENSLPFNHNNPEDLKTINGCELGCYFCNDVTAPGNVRIFNLVNCTYYVC